MMFSTCAVSCTPSAAVGSSMITSLLRERRGARDRHALALAARHVADRVVDVGNLDRGLLQRLDRALPHLAAVEPRERPERDADDLAAEEQVRGHVEVVGERKVLEHRLDAGVAGLERIGEVDLLALEEDLPAVGFSTPVICRTKVDLPAPLSPTTATCSPGDSVKSRLPGHARRHNAW